MAKDNFDKFLEEVTVVVNRGKSIYYKTPDEPDATVTKEGYSYNATMSVTKANQEKRAIKEIRKQVITILNKYLPEK